MKLAELEHHVIPVILCCFLWQFPPDQEIVMLEIPATKNQNMCHKKTAAVCNWSILVQDRLSVSLVKELGIILREKLVHWKVSAYRS